MSLTIEDLITREEIRETLNAYSQGLDQRSWELFDRVWTADATFEAKDEGIAAMPVAQFKELLKGNDATRLSGQHLLNNTWFQVDGDTAHTLTEVTWVTLQTTDKPDIFYEVRGGGMYVDDLVRTEDSWRVKRRELVTKTKVTRGVLYTQQRIDNIRWALETDFFI